MKDMDKRCEIMKLISSISAFSYEDVDLNDELDSIGIDSLKKVELIIALEDCFSIIFDDSDLDPLKLITVANIVELTEKYIKR